MIQHAKKFWCQPIYWGIPLSPACKLRQRNCTKRNCINIHTYTQAHFTHYITHNTLLYNCMIQHKKIVFTILPDVLENIV